MLFRSDKLIYVRNLIKRQNEIKNNIEEQGKMTPELSLAIDKVEKLQELEDIYMGMIAQISRECKDSAG